jgi:hypothetical protein
MLLVAAPSALAETVSFLTAHHIGCVGDPAACEPAEVAKCDDIISCVQECIKTQRCVSCDPLQTITLDKVVDEIKSCIPCLDCSIRLPYVPQSEEITSLLA